MDEDTLTKLPKAILLDIFKELTDGNDAGEADVETLVAIILGLYSDNSTFVSASLASYNANMASKIDEFMKHRSTNRDEAMKD